MDLYFIRHAHAGDRLAEHHDRYRQLSARGHNRAQELASFLADANITRVISSPATRCVQTVEPIAKAFGLGVEEDERLWEDSLRADALDVLTSVGNEGVAICSHGNIIPEVLELLSEQGTKLKGRGCEKGSIWVLTWDDKRFKKARYLPRKASGGAPKER